MADWQPLLKLLEENESTLAFAESDKRLAYSKEIKAEIEKAQLRDNDNKRAATLIAVDAAKTFVQIAIALVIAVVGFIQFSYRNVAFGLLVSLAAAAVLAFISMWAGFIVISRVYKRGDGRIASESPWSTAYIRGPINIQALSGVAALLTFAISLALFTSNVGAPKQLVITLPDGTTTVRTAVVPVVLRGSWTQLTVEQQGVFTIAIPAAPAAKPQSFRIDLR